MSEVKVLRDTPGMLVQCGVGLKDSALLESADFHLFWLKDSTAGLVTYGGFHWEFPSSRVAVHVQVRKLVEWLDPHIYESESHEHGIP